MDTAIKRATITDISEIAKIIQIAFHEETSLAQIQSCFQQQNHDTYIASNEGKIVGFIDGFVTIAIEGRKRLELDLLAVHPEYQGKGIGKKLITHFTNQANQVDLIRTLVAVGNHPMEKAISQSGYTALPDTYALYIGTGAVQNHAQSVNAHILPVSTFTYSGVWLEGDVSLDTIYAALKARNNEDEIVGLVTPISDEARLQVLTSANFEFIKHYRWWHMQLT